MEPDVAEAPTQNASVIQLLLTRSVIRTVVGIIIALCLMLGLQIFFSESHTPDPTLMNLLSLAIGVILGCYGQAFNWSFGSSPQSKVKDQALATLVDKIPTRANVPLKVDVVDMPATKTEKPKEKP